jgi:hypothetical protein
MFHKGSHKKILMGPLVRCSGRELFYPVRLPFLDPIIGRRERFSLPVREATGLEGMPPIDVVQ